MAKSESMIQNRRWENSKYKILSDLKKKLGNTYTDFQQNPMN